MPGDPGYDPAGALATAANLPDSFGNMPGDSGYDPQNALATAANLPDSFGNMPGDPGYDPQNALATAANQPDAFGNMPGDPGYDPQNAAATAANLPDAFGNMPGDPGYDPQNAAATAANLPDAFGNMPGDPGYDPQNAAATAANLPDAFGNLPGSPGYDPQNAMATAAGTGPKAERPPGAELAAKVVSGMGTAYEKLGAYISGDLAKSRMVTTADKILGTSLASKLAVSNPITGVAAKLLPGIGGALNAGADLIEHGAPKTSADWRSFGIAQVLNNVPGIGLLNSGIQYGTGKDLIGSIADQISGGSRYAKK